MINTLLQEYVNRRINQPTVILSFYILLRNHLHNGPTATMSKTEIETDFNAVHTNYGIATFRRDYVLRQCGHDENAIDQTADRFYIKSNFLEGMDRDDYLDLLGQIERHWNTFQDEQQRIINEIHELIESGTSDERYQYIVDMLCTREAVKRGQAFEVASFSVLNTFLFAHGFDLNRFSTTYSNDGGIDFVAQNAVLQVTTKLNERKFEEDIKKVPGKYRILVYKDLVNDFNLENFNHELVINHFSKEELCEKLNYLRSKNEEKFIPMILKTMESEFMREFYQNETES